MPDESTPLLAVVRVDNRPRRRYPHSTVRRFCTCFLGTLLVFCLVAILITLLFVPECDSHRRKHEFKPCVPKHPFYRPGNGGDRGWISSTSIQADVVDIFDILTKTPNETKAREWSQYYTSGPHLAGKNLSQAEWTQDRWDEFGIPHTEIVAYEVYVNYPVDHRLALLEDKASNKSSKKQSPDWKIKFEAKLEEDVLDEDSTTALEDRIPTFHGYSASGNVTASYIYVNYGTYDDFQDLVAANISLKGKIAVAKYGKIFRGLKVKRAQELGMVGCVMYSDPGDDGEVTAENGNKTYPDGPARNPSSVQRGSVQYICEYASTCPSESANNNSISSW
jgi:N-acetylated-alpha-linked acidic dipeptidase